MKLNYSEIKNFFEKKYEEFKHYERYFITYDDIGYGQINNWYWSLANGYEIWEKSACIFMDKAFLVDTDEDNEELEENEIYVKRSLLDNGPLSWIDGMVIEKLKKIEVQKKNLKVMDEAEEEIIEFCKFEEDGGGYVRGMCRSTWKLLL